MALGTLATIGAITSIAGTVGSTGMSIGQSVQQRRLQKEAEAEATKKIASARRQLDINVYEALGIPKEVYELEREALLQAGADALMAGMEANQRGAAATAGRVQLGQQQAQAGVRTKMAKDISDLERMTAAEESRLRDMRVQLDLEEAKGAQQAAGQAAQARQISLARTAAGVQQLGGQIMGLANLYEKTPGVRATERAFRTAERGGVSKAELRANLAKQGVVDGVDYSKVAGMNDADFETFLQEKANPAFINRFMESNYGTPFAPFSYDKRMGIQGQAVRENIASENRRIAALAQVNQELPTLAPLPYYDLPTDPYMLGQQTIPTQGYLNQLSYNQGLPEDIVYPFN